MCGIYCQFSGSPPRQPCSSSLSHVICPPSLARIMFGTRHNLWLGDWTLGSGALAVCEWGLRSLRLQRAGSHGNHRHYVNRNMTNAFHWNSPFSLHSAQDSTPAPTSAQARITMAPLFRWRQQQKHTSKHPAPFAWRFVKHCSLYVPPRQATFFGALTFPAVPLYCRS